jgi:hypothetical protein
VYVIFDDTILNRFLTACCKNNGRSQKIGRQYFAPPRKTMAAMEMAAALLAAAKNNGRVGNGRGTFLPPQKNNGRRWAPAAAAIVFPTA